MRIEENSRARPAFLRVFQFVSTKASAFNKLFGSEIKPWAIFSVLCYIFKGDDGSGEGNMRLKNTANFFKFAVRNPS